jgi:hypothetical protein
MAVRRRAWPSCAHSDAAVVADARAVSDPLTNASMDPHFANQDAMLDPVVATPLMPAAPPSPRTGEERGVEHDVREGGRVAARDESAAGRREMGLEGAREERLEWCAVVGRARDGDGGCEGGCLPLAPSLRGPSRGAGGCERLGRAEVARHRVGLGEDERPVVA